MGPRQQGRDAKHSEHAETRGFATRCVATTPNDCTGAVVPPIYLASTYAHPVPGSCPAPAPMPCGTNEDGGHSYQRWSNPTRAAVEVAVASLEDAKHCYAFATGMAAIAAVFSTIKTGQRVLLCSSIYGGTFQYISSFFPSRGINYDLIEDLNTLRPEQIPADTAMIYIESPTNPCLRIVDIEHAADLAHSVGAVLAIDNTFQTSYLQRPLDLGADIVAYSATKYMAGHGDVLAGMVLMNDEHLSEQVRLAQVALGAPLSPFDSYSVIRGLKTMVVRMDRQMENAQILREFLTNHPLVERIYFPGSTSADEAAIHSRQSRGDGSVLSFNLAPEVDISKMVAALDIIGYAVSLGGVETLICHPASMTHASMNDDELAAAGISKRMMRLAVGIEDVNDLQKELDRALKAGAE
ncbi:cystathionine gamma-synthase [Boudabousia liubingyangii]|uniref:Homocysteine desulfhydrase n=1 Tax=Boudabousia liubingyangii TaxID=1921764 RepID=A0A1Q5PQM6_9ACTO|nr:cystathionine gamma-synthase [Boudabousia liubingyangii]OKL49867.1 cystathionine gamma-synthase [Boudabousia liubingyangii]